jgi:probable DNA repair protein
MLRLAEEPVDVELVSSVLRSPYLGEAESELSPRALLDLRIRRFGDPVIRLRALIEAAADDSSEAGGGDSGTDACPLLASRLRPFFDRVSELPSRQMPSAWARDFSRLLGDLGWPGTGERSLESAEYQAMQAWRSALGDFSRLDAVARPLRYSAALDRLESHLATQSFQPETPEMPVQILGILESAGARFDKVWIMGLDSETWPAQPQPNPFLPARVQRLHSTPHADADRELAFARRLTRRMVRAAPEAILSHPAREKDRELLPSPLVRQEQEIGPGDLEIAAESDYRRTLLRSASLELVRDDHGPEVAEGTFLPGGTSLFRAQALCPFRAFAEHRLGATGIESPGAGLGPAERGVLVHEALNSVWRTFRSRDGLLQQDAEGVRAATEEAAEHALRRMDRRRPLTMTPRFRELERKRLVSLILEWLEREKERPPFEVSELENRVSVTIGGLTVQVAADRIDRLPDGRKVVLDYKTGRNSAKQWFDERMSEPQLPLYCIAVGERIAGLAFGRVRTGDTGYEGLTEDEGILPGCETWSRSRYCGRLPSWSAVLAAWSEGLERIAREIRCGEASPEPASGRQACRDCGLLPLCRADAGEYAREESDA